MGEFPGQPCLWFHYPERSPLWGEAGPTSPGGYLCFLLVCFHPHCLNAGLACLPRLPESLQHLRLAEAPLHGAPPFFRHVLMELESCFAEAPLRRQHLQQHIKRWRCSAWLHQTALYSTQQTKHTALDTAPNRLNTLRNTVPNKLQ